MTNSRLGVDANEAACGEVLYQENGIIGIYSRKFNPTKLNYTISEKKLSNHKMGGTL